LSLGHEVLDEEFLGGGRGELGVLGCWGRGEGVQWLW
jgi:hypothetical protein